MSGTDKKPTLRKSSILGINKVPEKTTVLSIAQALSSFASSITNISIETSRFGHRNVLITFDSVEACEKAKGLGNIKLEEQICDLFFAQTRNSSPSLSASTTKLYVKHPPAANCEEIVKMLGDVSIKKPEGAKGYFFVTCKDIDQQCEIVKNFNNKKVSGGALVVKVAIDKTVKRPMRNNKPVTAE
ncbi:uncharacterized protein VICG_01659 [Vittaforma corneae ATCC 50505]|uniref:RRM domain-containing protein n=1 Tax=Vittaforma corneae (strain ATCC 50505) TaxID=993615 RepID=L2GKB1_VITCO|nr:uncharacterized protein VICG_01659 [Vittaforma corneae ATCC 50505]ELA41286.1 hypothetical protein VICG_01659 [Vittaforma corneae ATCC 50505]